MQSRDWNHLESIHRMGDLTLKIPSDCWTLERLHLAEDPPRFGQMQVNSPIVRVFPSRLRYPTSWSILVAIVPSPYRITLVAV